MPDLVEERLHEQRRREREPARPSRALGMGRCERVAETPPQVARPGELGQRQQQRRPGRRARRGMPSPSRRATTRQASAGASMIPTGARAPRARRRTHARHVPALEEQERADGEHEEEALGVDAREHERERGDAEVETVRRAIGAEAVGRQAVDQAQPDREERRSRGRAEQHEVDEAARPVRRPTGGRVEREERRRRCRARAAGRSRAGRSAGTRSRPTAERRRTGCEPRRSSRAAGGPSRPSPITRS